MLESLVLIDRGAWQPIIS